MIGSKTNEALSFSWKTVWRATSQVVPSPKASPVLRLRSKRGKLLELISSPMRWPGRKTLLVAHRSMVYRYAFAGSMRVGLLAESRSGRG